MSDNPKPRLDDIADLIVSGSTPSEEVIVDDVADSPVAAVEEEETGVPLEGEAADEVDEVDEFGGETTEEVDDEVVVNDEIDEGTAGIPVDNEAYLDVTDEDLIEVKVDGEVIYRTIADAKKALSGEGAIEKRLKDATLLNQRANADQATGIRALEDERTKLLDMVSQLDQHIFQPSVPLPTNELRQQDPSAYLQHLDAYNADQARIAQGRSQLAKNIDQQKQEKANNIGVLRQQNEVELVRRIPALADPKQARGIMTGIMQVGKNYGFSDAEISQFFDHRSYYMAYELMTVKNELARIRSGAKVVPSKGNDNVSRVPRRLRSGVAKKKLVAQQKNKSRKARFDKARATGKVDDVVATILKA